MKSARLSLGSAARWTRQEAQRPTKEQHLLCVIGIRSWTKLMTIVIHATTSLPSAMRRTQSSPWSNELHSPLDRQKLKAASFLRGYPGMDGQPRKTPKAVTHEKGGGAMEDSLRSSPIDGHCLRKNFHTPCDTYIIRCMRCTKL
jgi:hypothetical protein